ncbi:MAG: 4Fe-4S ferredoxin [Actinobacteria bacterium]|nr:4Fe-4S ferredoxin [Actinomycetota bacterium]
MSNEIRIISREDLPKWLDQMLGTFTVVAPTRQDDYTNFGVITSGNQADFDAVNTRMSPKQIFFPKTERLFGFATDRQQVKLDDTPQQITPQVLFGVRPCDARSIAMLDKVFDTDVYRDQQYVSRRKATTIVSLACKQLAPSCFCTRLGSNPADMAGSDLLIIELPEDRFAIGTLTPKGADLLTAADLPAQATAQDAQAFDKAVRIAQDTTVKPIDSDKLAAKLARIFDSAFWDRWHDRCLGCGTCTYLCPTCHCFDIADEAKNNTGQRVRNWDSCMFDLFTLHASGHNPRPSQRQHLRQRVMHKFSYTVDRYGQAFCVGCGRCVNRCPVNIDIREILDELEDYQGG